MNWLEDSGRFSKEEFEQMKKDAFRKHTEEFLVPLSELIMFGDKLEVLLERGDCK